MIYTKKQKNVIKYGNKRWNILTGATRSGKTFVDTSYRIVNAFLGAPPRATSSTTPWWSTVHR